MMNIKKEPLAKPQVNKPWSSKTLTIKEVANTLTKKKSPKSKKATQDQNKNPAASITPQKAKQSKQNGTAVDDVEAPANVPDHAALLAHIKELECEFGIL